MSFRLADFAAAIGVADAECFAARCENLRTLLEERNRRVNLTRLTDREDFELKHVADSLCIFRSFPELLSASARVADVGCGAGFPGLILALAAPCLKVTAIDSTGKKIAFAAEAAAALGLTNFKAVQGRAVELNRKEEYRGHFDVITARAVADSPRIHAECRNFPAPGGRFIFYKTPTQAETELPELRKLPGMEWRVSATFALPENSGERCFVVGSAR